MTRKAFGVNAATWLHRKSKSTCRLKSILELQPIRAVTFMIKYCALNFVYMNIDCWLLFSVSPADAPFLAIAVLLECLSHHPSTDAFFYAGRSKVRGLLALACACFRLLVACDLLALVDWLQARAGCHDVTDRITALYFSVKCNLRQEDILFQFPNL